MARVALCIGLAGLLAACSSGGAPQPKNGVPPQKNGGYSLPPPPGTAARAPALVEPGEAVWHLRAGLNVAALSCKGRGRTPVSGLYSRVLARHKSLLSQAYAGEQRRHGKGLDRHLTQLYNRFSNQRNPEKFCASAASVGKRAAAMDSPALAANSRSLLSEID
jgi:hypothetical protein